MPSPTERSAEQDALDRLLANPAILPLLPMIYVAWSDGELTVSEIQLVLNEALKQKWIDPGLTETLSEWLNPDDPPSAFALQAILQAITDASTSLSHHQRTSLADLGTAIAQQTGLEKTPDWNPAGLKNALDLLEDALGLVRSESGQGLLAQVVPPAATPHTEASPAFNINAMTQFLDGKHAAIRREVRQILSNPEFAFSYGLPLDAHRNQVHTWLQQLARTGIGERCFPIAELRKKTNAGTNANGADQHRDMSQFLAIFETLGFFDLNLPVKFGVQYGLFGGSIYFLGNTEHQKKYLPDIVNLDLIGCYAMTEMGRGSNVRDLETTAVFDPETDEFIIHTPTESARKEWIGGAGRYATMATVFAQLEVDGQHHGVHAFLVPIRDENHNLQPGIRIQDMGPKMGLNGIDNGRIWFDHVRIPRQNLLDRFGKVNEHGLYTSPIPGANKRFFTMLSTLVAGRLGVAAAALSASKTGLAIAIRYGAQRRQFGPAGQPEIPILDYRMHQRKLIPHLATSYALSFALDALSTRYNDPTYDNRREIEAHAAGIKAFSSWHAVNTLQACREACGGQGYLSLNRLPGLRTDVDVFVTFEGANIVMMQQVAKARLTEYGHELSDANFFTIARYLARQATSTLSETNPVTTRNTDEDHLRSANFQLNAFRYRENDLLVGVSRRIKRRIDNGMDSFDAFNDCQDHVIALAHAHIERIILEDFLNAVERCTEPALKTQLKNLCDLFALSHIEKDAAWFLENNYLHSSKAAAIRDLVNKLCYDVRLQALPLVDAFAIPDSCLSAPIAFSDNKAPAESRPEFAHGLASTP